MRLIFAGSSEFALPALAALLERIPPLLVISQPDKPAGRNQRLSRCPVSQYAAERGLKLWQPESINGPETLALLRDLQPDLIVTASYGGMLRKAVRESARLGAVNLHPSLLPLYRGATPVQSALLDGARVTGVTIFRMNARLDAGDILCQQELPVLPEDNHSSLEPKLAALAANLLIELLPRLAAGDVSPVAQDDSRATHTAKIDRDSLRLDWSQPSVDVLNRVRAFALEPGAFSVFRGSPLKILSAAEAGTPALDCPGSIGEIIKNTGFMVNCRDSQLLIRQVQAAGKKALDAWAYHLGARLSPGERFEAAPQPTPNREYQ